MNKTILALALSAAAFSGAAHAAMPADLEVSYNASVVSDYRYRGISQTRLMPALQGGVDATLKSSGYYAGAWASTIKWTKDAGGSGDVEIDLYAGKRGSITESLSYDVGVLTYLYPSNGLGSVPGFASANTTEVYGQLGYGPVYAKYSHSVTNLFGFVDSKNSGYLDLGANVDVGSGIILNLHFGRQLVRNSSASYTDRKIGVTKDFGFATGSVALVSTDIETLAPNGKNLSKAGLVVGITKTF